MKTFATLIFVLFIGAAAQAQDVKVETIEMGIATEIVVDVKVEKTTEVARLYRRKNSTVKKELSFTTKRDAAKMA
ncbi:MAG: hypothetical protein WBM83_11010 [Flavobacteriaceae bacterium]